LQEVFSFSAENGEQPGIPVQELAAIAPKVAVFLVKAHEFSASHFERFPSPGA
jgi:hypothetical protein